MAKVLAQKYGHAWILLYVPIYMIWFTWLEKRVTVHYHIMHSFLDNQIPFCSVFIIPYLLWFIYIAAVVVYFFFFDKQAYYRCCAYLFIGMSIALFICTVFPNGTDLRPNALSMDNPFDRLVSMLYKTDTCTNVFPSIHVFNSIAACIAVFKSRSLGHRKWVCGGAFLLSVFICMSTVFLKQHSTNDVLGAILLAQAMYPFIYVFKYHKFSTSRTKKLSYMVH